METFRVEVGDSHGLKAGNLVGAIANEAGLEGAYIGRIDIRDDHAFVDLPAGMPRRIFRDLQQVWVVGRQLKISRVAEGSAPREAPRGKPAGPKTSPPPKKRRP
jgi:ATP-dependent RNA helicase DeaD